MRNQYHVVHFSEEWAVRGQRFFPQTHPALPPQITLFSSAQIRSLSFTISPRLVLIRKRRSASSLLTDVYSTSQRSRAFLACRLTKSDSAAILLYRRLLDTQLPCRLPVKTNVIRQDTAMKPREIFRQFLRNSSEPYQPYRFSIEAAFRRSCKTIRLPAAFLSQKAMLLAVDRIRVIVSSATGMDIVPAVFVTAIPNSLAASRSTFVKPDTKPGDNLQSPGLCSSPQNMPVIFVSSGNHCITVFQLFNHLPVCRKVVIKNRLKPVVTNQLLKSSASHSPLSLPVSSQFCGSYFSSFFH